MALNTSSKFIYFGPTLARGQLVKNTIFSGGLPTHIPDVFARYPLIKFLFASPKNLTEKESLIKTAGTLENQAYEEIKAGGFR